MTFSSICRQWADKPQAFKEAIEPNYYYSIEQKLVNLHMEAENCQRIALVTQSGTVND
jgi:putative heme iron utilization protein